ncbi:hypothetical protein [Streptomyces chisholmiae]
MALAVVGFFAYQASAADNWPPPTRSSPTPEAEGDGGANGGAEDEAEVPPLPADSGTGERVVYSLEQRRVWLVEVSPDGTGDIVRRTHEVFPSSRSPEPGGYQVTSRSERGTGSDGVPMEHAVVFAVAADGTVFGFSAAQDGSTPDPAAADGTGGIRQTREDGAAMWEFAAIDVPVVVVP